MITGRTKVFALVGHPIRHSLSPAMHNELFRRRDIDAVYVALDTPPERADGVGPGIRALGLSGCNLTVPFKERVISALDELSPEAEVAGAVNVVVNHDGVLRGYNTDGEGYLRALREELGVAAAGADCAVLGAGGTGRAVAAALAGAGAARITLFNRTLSRAEAAVERLAARFPGVRVVAAPLGASSFATRPFSIVVNCLSGEGADAARALDVRHLVAGSVWTDANYWMSDPPQLAACAARGLRIQRGIGMLMHQGALSFGLFSGVAVDADTIRGVLDIGGW